MDDGVIVAYNCVIPPDAGNAKKGGQTMNCSKMCPITSEKILLATDGSQYSAGAIKEAIQFAKKCSSKLYAMSVVEVITDYEEFSPQKV